MEDYNNLRKFHTSLKLPKFDGIPYPQVEPAKMT